MASDGPSPHSPSLRLGLPAPQPSRRHHAQSLLGPSFHDPRTHHILDPTPSKPRLSLAATMSDDTLSALTPSLHGASILQPAAPPQVVAFEPWTISRTILFWRTYIYILQTCRYNSSKFAPKAKNLQNFKTLPLIQM